ncbi:broad substrate specificity ATP-binding cassette transporter ABCG2 isoform 2-T2 [Molossus nigricans]
MFEQFVVRCFSCKQGLKPMVEAFFMRMFTLIMVTYTASSMALAIAAGQSVVSIATLLMDISFVFMMWDHEAWPQRHPGTHRWRQIFVSITEYQLLDILAAKKDPQGLSGDVLINGAPPPANFKCNLGYVVQDDVVMGTLTVRENLQFSAALRLPSTMTNHEKNERINTIIQELGLAKVADSKIGTPFTRGVSGGERKRTSIGMELITNPSILFLDEPTTGLDSSSANALLSLLKRMEDAFQMTAGSYNVSIPVSQRKTSGLDGTTPNDQTSFTEGAVLSFHNICYRIKVKSGFLLSRKTIEKEILMNINGIMRPGLNAILGPTGGGKSSLLDILAARKHPQGLSGDVLINGAPRPANFKCNSGYVVQDDVVMGTLTVRENLQFSAALRLPSTMTNHEKNERINTIIQELGLAKVADSKVGTQFIRGVSGGERKRTSIGMELITDPSILFLDEPTTGLDSSTANAVLSLLKRMSKQGRTIIFSIHQPRYSIFKLFDSLTLLASGRLMFHGPAQEALGYFASAGHHCEPYNNPADFFLDVINGDSSAVVLNREDEDGEAKKTEEPLKRDKPLIEKLAEFYVNSNFFTETKVELNRLSGVQTKKKSTGFKESTYATSFCHQLRWISKRSFKNLLGNPQASIAQIIITVVLGLVIGAIFYGLTNDPTGIQNRAGVLFFLTTNQCFSSVSSVELFVVEKKLFMHEYISGYYRVSSYFFGKLLSDLLPMRMLPSIIFTCIIYFLLGLKPTVEAFFTMMFTLMMVAYSASSMALAIAAGQSVVSIATLLMTITFVFMMIFSGLLVNLRTIVPWLSWLQYFSIPRYGYAALQHNEFLGQNFCPGLNVTANSTCSFAICTGEQFLMNQGIDLSPWGLWRNHVALASMIVIFLTIAYLKLLFLNKYS